jgi:hypothetical protein
MRSRTRLIAIGVGALTLLGAGVGAGLAESRDDRPLRGTELERATDAALSHVGDGTVVETEVGDDGASFEAEIRRADGTEVEVELDDNFQVIGTEAEEEDGD